MNIRRVAVFLALILAIAHSFRFTIDSKNPELSMFFNVTSGRHTFDAVSSGEENHDINVTIAYSHSRQSTEQILAKTGNDIEFSYNYPEDGRINITILAASSGGYRNVSFDFFSQDDPLVKMIDKKDLKLVEAAIIRAQLTLDTISRNQQFQIERDESHKVTLEDSQSSIKWTGIVKIVFLLSSALIQLWIMKGFFKGSSSRAYEAVQSHDSVQQG